MVFNLIFDFQHKPCGSNQSINCVRTILSLCFTINKRCNQFDDWKIKLVWKMNFADLPCVRHGSNPVLLWTDCVWMEVDHFTHTHCDLISFDCDFSNRISLLIGQKKQLVFCRLNSISEFAFHLIESRLLPKFWINFIKKFISQTFKKLSKKFDWN